jgi:ATP-dependent DNA ligase
VCHATRHDASVFLYAFDLIELDGDDLRHDPAQSNKQLWCDID